MHRVEPPQKRHLRNGCNERVGAACAGRARARAAAILAVAATICASSAAGLLTVIGGAIVAGRSPLVVVTSVWIHPVHVGTCARVSRSDADCFGFSTARVARTLHAHAHPGAVVALQRNDERAERRDERRDERRGKGHLPQRQTRHERRLQPRHRRARAAPTTKLIQAASLRHARELWHHTRDAPTRRASLPTARQNLK